MACSATLWRPASTPLPPTARFVGGGSQRAFGAATIISIPSPRPANPYPRLRRSGLCFARRHSSAVRPRSDEGLLAVIDSEIKSAKESEDPEQAVEIPKDFPFKIDDRPMQQTIILTRQYNGETITVEVSMPDVVPSIENEVEDDNEEDDNEEETISDFSIPLNVSVSKTNGPSLEFSCTAFSDEIAIDDLSLKYPEVEDDQVAYEGPDFGDLDENLQKTFHKYLEVRGIKPSIANFLYEYMVQKDSKEYLRWLNGLKKFIVA
ncbi:hypothetical protein Dimus_033783 [Dionaea muscipula]